MKTSNYYVHYPILTITSASDPKGTELKTKISYAFCIKLHCMKQTSKGHHSPLPVPWRCLLAERHDCAGQYLPTCCPAVSSIQKPCSLQPTSTKIHSLYCVVCTDCTVCWYYHQSRFSVTSVFLKSFWSLRMCKYL